MWFKITETRNWDGLSEEIYENCIKNRFANKSEYIKGIFNNHYKTEVNLESTEELIEFIECCGTDVVITKDREIEIYNGCRE